MKTEIYYQLMEIGEVSESSSICCGDNVQFRFRHTSKTNQGFGATTGKGNVIADHRSKLSDQDQVDMLRIRKLDWM